MCQTYRPLQLNELVDEPLPFHELDEIIVALRVTEDVTEDALNQLAEHGAGDVNLEAARRQLADMARLRKHYTARLVNLAGRLPEATDRCPAITTLSRPSQNGDGNTALAAALEGAPAPAV